MNLSKSVIQLCNGIIIVLVLLLNLVYSNWLFYIKRKVTLGKFSRRFFMAPASYAKGTHPLSHMGHPSQNHRPHPLSMGSSPVNYFFFILPFFCIIFPESLYTPNNSTNSYNSLIIVTLIQLIRDNYVHNITNQNNQLIFIATSFYHETYLGNIIDPQSTIYLRNITYP